MNCIIYIKYDMNTICSRANVDRQNLSEMPGLLLITHVHTKSWLRIYQGEHQKDNSLEHRIKLFLLPTGGWTNIVVEEYVEDFLRHNENWVMGEKETEVWCLMNSGSLSYMHQTYDFIWTG